MRLIQQIHSWIRSKPGHITGESYQDVLDAVGDYFPGASSGDVEWCLNQLGYKPMQRRAPDGSYTYYISFPGDTWR